MAIGGVLPSITQAGMGPVTRARERGIFIVAGPPVVWLWCVVLRREGVVGVKARLRNWDRLCGRGRRWN